MLRYACPCFYLAQIPWDSSICGLKLFHSFWGEKITITHANTAHPLSLNFLYCSSGTSFTYMSHYLPVVFHISLTSYSLFPFFLLCASVWIDLSSCVTNTAYKCIQWVSISFATWEYPSHPFCGFHSLLKFFIFSSNLSIFSSNFFKIWATPTLKSLSTNFIIRSSCESANFFSLWILIIFSFFVSCVYQSVHCTLYGK